MTRNLSLCWHDHPNSLAAFLQTLVSGNSLTDCTLAADGKYVRAHKVVLSACSPYFQLLFDQEKDKNPIVVLKDVQYECLKGIIDFVYLGEVQIRETQLKTFLEVARSLQIKGLDSRDGSTKRSPSTRSKTRGSALQSMEYGASDEVFDVSEDCKVVRVVNKIAKTSPSEQCRSTSPSQLEDVKNITIESAYSIASSPRSAPELSESGDSEGLDWSVCSAPPSVASSEADSIETLHNNETHESNTTKCVPDENSSAKDVTAELESQTEKRGVLSEQNDHTERKRSRRPATRRSPGRKASGAGSGGGAGRGKEAASEGDGETSGAEPPARKKAKGPTKRVWLPMRFRVRNIACPHCPKKFARPTDLTVHARRHTGERPFRCPTCDAAFSQTSDLKRHLLVHTGERPYACDVCGQRFNRSSAVKIHARRHTGERPYACEDCDKTFAAHSQLWAHRRTHRAGKYTCDACGLRFKRKHLVAQHWVVAHAPRPRVAITKLDGAQPPPATPATPAPPKE